MAASLLSGLGVVDTLICLKFALVTAQGTVLTNQLQQLHLASRSTQ